MKTSFYRKKGKLTLFILALAVISQSVASCGRKDSRSTDEPGIDISTLEDYSPEQLEQMNSSPYINKISNMGDIGSVKRNISDQRIIDWCGWELED